MAGLSLIEELSELKPGDHLCCIYDSEEEHRAVLAPFISQGLDKGEKVLYIVDTHTAEEILGYLSESGIDTESYLRSGQLAVLSVDDAYMKEGIFDPDGMICLLEEETDKALSEGYSALRVTGEMTWALKGLPGSERLIEYEAKLNHFFPGSSCMAVCQYDRNRFGADVLLQVLTTHPFAVIGKEVYDNFYYIHPEEYLGSILPEKTLDLRVENLKSQKRAQVELEEREEREKAILDASLESITLVKVDGTVLTCNEMTARRLGREVGELIGSNIFDFFPPDVAASRRAIVDRGFREGQIMRFEDEHQGIYFDNTVYPIFGRKGEVEMLAVFAKDVTERKQAEQALLESEKRFRELVETAPVSIAIFQDGMTRYVNPANVEMCGYTLEEQTAMDPMTVVHGDYRERVSRRIAAVLGGDESPGQYEIKVVTKDGRERWWDISTSTIDYEGRPAMMGISIDVTERKQADAEMLASKERWERTFGAVKEGLFIMDIEQNILQCNPAFAEIVGWEVQDLLGRKCFEVVHDKDHPPADCITCSASQRSEEVRAEVYEPSLGKYFEMFANPVHGIDGEPDSIIHVIRDITERKRAEEKLEQFAYDLQERIKALNCLYGISRIVEKAGLSLEDMMFEIAEIMPSSWQYPDITCARITLQDGVFETGDFQETPWRLSREIIVHGVKAGDIEVCYLEERPEADTGPFLVEENELLRAVAERLGRIVERREAQAELKRYREQLEELVGERTRELQETNILLQKEIAERKRKEVELKTAAGQLRALSTRMESILEEERKRISLEVHDKLGQELTGLKMNLSLLEKKMAGNEEYMERIREISELADDIIQSVQEISMELRPSILDDLGLDAALEWQLDSFGETADIKTCFISTVDSHLIDPDLGTALFRIFQEALTNIARHADAGRVEVELSGEGGELVLIVSDDGRGIKEREKSGIGSLGILGMRQRAKAFGGRIDISEEENGGTTIKVRIPFAKSGESEISREELES